MVEHDFEPQEIHPWTIAASRSSTSRTSLPISANRPRWGAGPTSRRAERLPNERSTYQGTPTWSITAYVKFSETGQPQSYVLKSLTGPVRRKTTNESGSGTIMKANVPVPVNASEVILWFVNTGRSGAVYYDSDYGRNYWFRFVQNDIRVISDQIVSDPETPYSGFGVQVSAAPALTGVSVHYRVHRKCMNTRHGGRVRLLSKGQDLLLRITDSDPGSEGIASAAPVSHGP